MRTFKDNQGREWSLKISVGTLKRCLAEMQLDLIGLFDDGCEPLARLGSDPIRLVDLIFWLVREQAVKLGLDAEGLQFAEGLGGDTLFAAREAFVEALIDVLPTSEQRDRLRQVVEKNRALLAQVSEQSRAILDAIDIRERAREILDQAREQLEAEEMAAASAG